MRARIRRGSAKVSGRDAIGGFYQNGRDTRRRRESGHLFVFREHKAGVNSICRRLFAQGRLDRQGRGGWRDPFTRVRVRPGRP
jgi:hypothetical protein